MKYIYLLEQTDNRGYDTYDSMVVIADDANEAKLLSFEKAYMLREEYDYDTTELDTPFKGYGYVLKRGSTWSSNVTFEQIGIADRGIPSGIICASFNAG